MYIFVTKIKRRSMLNYRKDPKHQFLFQKLRNFIGITTINQFETETIPGWESIVNLSIVDLDQEERRDPAT